MKFIPSKVQSRLVEVGQHVDIRWILARVDGEDLIGLHTPVKCTDYFNDLTVYIRANTALDYDICGLALRPCLLDTKFENARIVLYIPGKTAAPILSLVQEAVNRLDDILHTSGSRVDIIDIDGAPGLVIKPNIKWFSFPALISFFTKTIRAAIGIRQVADKSIKDAAPDEIILDVIFNFYYAADGAVPKGAPESLCSLYHLLPFSKELAEYFIKRAHLLVDIPLTDEFYKYKVNPYSHIHGHAGCRSIANILRLSGSSFFDFFGVKEAGKRIKEYDACR